MASIWDGLSFDPLTWRDPALPAGRSAALAHRRHLLQALAGSAAILVAGGITARLMRGPAGGSASFPEAVGGALAPTIRRAFRVDGASGLRDSLAASGVKPLEAAEVVSVAQKSLVATGEIAAALTFDRADPTHLLRAEFSNPDTSGVVVAHDGKRFVGRLVPVSVTGRFFDKRGVMDADSFYSSAVAAGVTDSLIAVFARALAFDFDFQRDVHRGDAFEAAFEQNVDANNQPIGPPRLLFASLTTSARSAAVYAFTPPGGEEGWFDASGRSVVRALMRTPVDGARVSSTFGMRVHPVLGFEKLHKGIDFAAAVGTPIFAAGDALVESANLSETAGNMAKLRHDNGWETVYMHMNRFMPGVVTGARVRQGQQIGEVGTTGRSTGPHLHYEVHIAGEPVDPTSIDTGSGVTLAGDALERFNRERDRIDVSRTRATV
jgi:murein DD-endopeptidase MepM/ murein hydrolase activator NlpD